MEHGIITSTKYEQGVVLCNVQAVRIDTEYRNVPMLKPFAAFNVVPAIGQRVAMASLSDGTRLITDVIASNPDGSQPDDLAEGELSIQLDANTKLTFTKNANGDYDVDLTASGAVTVTATSDVDLTASGSVFINGINFENHIHPYADDTINDTGDGSGSLSSEAKQTDPPK